VVRHFKGGEKMKSWLKERLIALLDNFLWFVVLGIVMIVAGALFSYYKDSPQNTLLWFLVFLCATDTVILLLIHHNLTLRRAAKLHVRHRNTTSKYYDDVFSTGLEVFIVSIMSRHTLREIESRLREAEKSRTRLNVLTLDPTVDRSVVEAIRLHLNEPPQDTDITARQIRQAWEQWSVFAEKYTNVRVRRYRSIPTLQGVLVRDRDMSVELIPFDTQTRDRPGLFLTQKEDPDIFSLFQEKFVALWESAQV
jgi:hypothetical protein